MNKWTLPIVLFLFFILLACQNSGSGAGQQKWMAANDKVKVLSTIAMIDDLIKEIGGEHVDSFVLIQGDIDPHSYQLVKGDDEKLAYADLIFYNGLGLEHGPSLKNYLQYSPKAIGLGNQIQKQAPALILDYNGQVDPHIWMDISLWSKTVPFIVDALVQKDPAHAEIYQKNGDRFLKAMQQAHEDIQTIMRRVPAHKRFLVTSHDAFNYFARAYLAEEGEENQASWQKRFAAPEGLAPESQLSATDILLIIEHLHRYNIQVLFPETNVSKDSIRKIMQAGQEKGLTLTIATHALYADAMGHPGSEGDTYLKMIRYNAKVIASYLNGDKRIITNH
jgi:manganese/zinc/iron transport system substrate-binding protein